DGYSYLYPPRVCLILSLCPARGWRGSPLPDPACPTTPILFVSIFFCFMMRPGHYIPTPDICEGICCAVSEEARQRLRDQWLFRRANNLDSPPGGMRRSTRVEKRT